MELDPGPYHVEVSAPGYKTSKEWISLEKNSDKNLSVSLVAASQGGDAAPESGIYPLYEIRNIGRFSYSSFRDGIIVDKANWDGSDFFTVNGYPKFILITERVKELIIANQLTNCALIPSHELEWKGKRPEESLEETRVMANRSLESLLEDLENPDLAMDTIHALGHKGDPRAVDALINKFDHPDPLIWNSAASAVAAIAQHKEAPGQAREEIISKLTGSLSHDDPAVRKSAATALGYIGGERAAEEVMKLLDDPDASVRGKAVFVMGMLRHKPAMEAIRRLTRDKSKSVRENARRVLRELSSEFS